MVGQSLFNNDNEILQPTLTVQHLKPFQHTILRFKTFMSAMEAKLMQKKSQNYNTHNGRTWLILTLSNSFALLTFSKKQGHHDDI
jgi:hypothetical protein